MDRENVASADFSARVDAAPLRLLHMFAVSFLRGVRAVPCARLALHAPMPVRPVCPVRLVPSLLRCITTDELKMREQRLRAAAAAQKTRNQSIALYSAAAVRGH